MRAVSDAEIAAYRPLCTALAAKYDGVDYAEFDDLEQEGMIAVWHLLRRDYPISKVAVQHRMQDWMRKCKRRGISYRDPLELV